MLHYKKNEKFYEKCGLEAIPRPYLIFRPDYIASKISFSNRSSASLLLNTKQPVTSF